MVRPRERAGWLATGTSLTAVTLLVAATSRVGADLEWLVALGDAIRSSGHVVEGVPFAQAPTQDWPNVLVLAEVLLSWIHSGGAGALLLWHVAMSVAALTWLVLDARRRGATDLGAALIPVLVVVGGFATFGVARLQSWSLPAFVALFVLLRTQHARPDRRIWWVMPLVVVWGNLHGAVLLGVCVLGTYLVFSRLRGRPLETVLVGLASLAALWVTPATWRTGDYYLGVLGNESAIRKEGLWAPLTLSDPVDATMVIAAVVLGVLALRRRLPLWEYAALVGLAAATVMGSRHGVWLLLALAVPAALGSVAAPEGQVTWRPAPGWLVVGLGACVVAGGLAAHRGADDSADQDRLARQVADRVGPGIVLAPGSEAEFLAVHGVLLWASNPIDAFDPVDQRAYLDFLDGRPGMARAVAASDAVLGREATAASIRMDRDPAFEKVGLIDDWVLYLRTDPSS